MKILKSSLIAIAKILRKNSTDAERLLWKHLKKNQIERFKFRRQQPIGNYIVDFVCFEKGIVIEVDGGQHAIDNKKDNERDMWLQTEGFKVLRFWNNEVLQNIEGVLEVIRKNCLMSPSPNPSHQGRGITQYKMMMCCIILISGLLTIALPAHAWQLPIEVATYNDKGEKVYNKLVAGIESGATDSFDNLWDAPALTSHPDPDNPVHLSAYIVGTETGRDETGRLWKDIRGPIARGDTVWEIVVEAAPAGKPVIISWDQPQIVLKTGEKLILKDNGKSGANVEKMLTDVTSASNYSYVSDGEEPRSLSLMFSKESVGASSSGGGSGFGCGTITADRHRPDDRMTAVLSTVILFLPVVVIRLVQLRKKREELRY